MLPEYCTQAMATVLLDQDSALDHWAQGEFFDALAARIDLVMGMAAFLMLICVVIYLSLYYWSQNYTVPTVVLTLSGGVIIAQMPPAVARIGWIIIFLGGGLGLFGLLWGVYR